MSHEKCFACKRDLGPMPKLAVMSGEYPAEGTYATATGGQGLGAERRYYSDEDWALIETWEKKTGKDRYAEHELMLASSWLCGKCAYQSEQRYQAMEADAAWAEAQREDW